jgi:hypothetical protein
MGKRTRWPTRAGRACSGRTTVAEQSGRAGSATALGVRQAAAGAGTHDRFHHSPVAELTIARATEQPRPDDAVA